MNSKHNLEEWAAQAAQALQEVCDEAQQQSQEPYAATERQDLRDLITELDEIIQ